MLSLSVLLLAEAASPLPYRVAVERMPITVKQEDAAACSARQLATSGRTTVYPLPDGTGIDWTVTGPFGGGGISLLTFQIRHDDAGGFVSVSYRRPMSAKGGVGSLRNIAKACFADDWNAWSKAVGEKPVPARQPQE